MVIFKIHEYLCTKLIGWNLEKRNCFATLIMNQNLPTFVRHCYWPLPLFLSHKLKNKK